MKKAIVFIVCLVAASFLISKICYANEMVTGVAKSFDAKTGRLVMQTATQREVTFSIPQTVKVYQKVKGEDIAVTNPWHFLQHNLGNRTKLQLMHSGVVVTTIWILEVPR
jgi:hypothetical protein